MFGARDEVNTANFKCQRCRQPLFLLLDETAPNQQSGTELVVLFCINCQAKEQRLVTQTMSEMAGSGHPITKLPFQANLPDNALLCGQEAPIGKLAPNGVCHGAVFQILERGNELLSRCTSCGKGDSVGMIHGAVQ